MTHQYIATELSPRNKFIQLSKTNSKLPRCQLAESRNPLGLMRCWFSAACQETILPLLRQIPRDFHSICNHEWDWMGLGSTSNQRLKNNQNYIIKEAYSADLLRQLQEDTIISWQGDCSSAWTMLHCHNGWKMHPDLDLSNSHPIYPIQDPQTATSSQTLRGVQKSPVTKMPTSTGKGSVCFMTAGL